ncbi:hypothetical protein PG997_008478 [Apiospora hydei]|uniref:Uncharacterized protein n=1 Tax=Apiospora hydei TaxID=1337664 RepID=A0ABR1WDY0_9PEZI
MSEHASTHAPLILLAEEERILDADKATQWLVAMEQLESTEIQNALRLGQLEKEEQEEWLAFEENSKSRE